MSTIFRKIRRVKKRQAILFLFISLNFELCEINKLAR